MTAIPVLGMFLSRFFAGGGAGVPGGAELLFLLKFSRRIKEFSQNQTVGSQVILENDWDLRVGLSGFLFGNDHRCRSRWRFR